MASSPLHSQASTTVQAALWPLGVWHSTFASTYWVAFTAASEHWGLGACSLEKGGLSKRRQMAKPRSSMFSLFCLSSIVWLERRARSLQGAWFFCTQNKYMTFGKHCSHFLAICSSQCSHKDPLTRASLYAPNNITEWLVKKKHTLISPRVVYTKNFKGH